MDTRKRLVRLIFISTTLVFLLIAVKEVSNILSGTTSSYYVVTESGGKVHNYDANKWDCNAETGQKLIVTCIGDSGDVVISESKSFKFVADDD